MDKGLINEQETAASLLSAERTAFAAQVQYVPSLTLRQESAGLQSLLNAFPIPTGPEIADSTGNPSGLAPFISAYSLPGDANSVSARIDQNLFSTFHLFVRYNETPSMDEFRQLSSLTQNTANSRTFTAGLDIQFSSRISNRLRASYARDRTQRFTNLDSYSGAVPINLDKAFGNNLETGPYSGGFYTTGLISILEDAYVRIPGIGSTTLLKSYANNEVFQWDGADDFVLQKGNHTLGAGFDIRILNSSIEGATTQLESSLL